MFVELLLHSIYDNHVVDDLVDTTRIILPRHVFNYLYISLCLCYVHAHISSMSPHVTNVSLKKGQKLSEQSLAILSIVKLRMVTKTYHLIM